MPYCPKCEQEYRPEVVRCADCDVNLIPALVSNEEPVASGPEPKWVPVWTGDFAEAGVVRSALEAAGIEAFVPKESVFPDAGIDVETSYGVEVLVKEEDVTGAREVLAGLDRVEEAEENLSTDDFSPPPAK